MIFLFSARQPWTDKYILKFVAAEDMPSCSNCTETRSGSIRRNATHFWRPSSIKASSMSEKITPYRKVLHTTPFSSDMTIRFYSALSTKGINLNKVLSSSSSENILQTPRGSSSTNLYKPICGYKNIKGTCVCDEQSYDMIECEASFGRSPNGHYLLQTAAEFHLKGKKSVFKKVVETTFQLIRRRYRKIGRNFDKKLRETNGGTVTFVKFSFRYKRFTSEGQR